MKPMMLLTVIALIFGVAGFTLAQDMAPVVCGDLPEADCEILRQNQQAMLEVDSYSFAIAADFTLANIPDMPDDVSFSLAGNGAFIGDQSALVMAPEDAMTLMSDPQAYGDFLSGVFENVDMQLSLVLTMPEALIEETDGEMPETIPLDFVIADGVGYINFTTLRNAVGEAGESFPEGWYGIDLSGLITQAMSMTEAMGSMEAMNPDMMSRFTDPEFLGEFMTIERLEDTTAADGTPVASFHTVVDYQALISDPAMQELMLESMAMQGVTLSDAELEQFNAMMTQMFQGVTLEVFTTIGLEDHYTRTTQVTMNFDMASVMALAGEMDDDVDMEGPAPVLRFNAVVTSSNFNAVEPISAPENATIIPLESLGMMGDMSGAGALPPAAETEAAAG